MKMMRMIQRAGAGLGMIVAVTAGDWRGFHGPNGTGVADGKGPRSWTAKEGVEWRIDLPGAGWSTPVIAGDKLVLTAAVGEGEETKLTVLAYELGTGKELWRTVAFEPSIEDQQMIHPKNSLASPTPLLADGRVYVHFGHMGTAALDLETGKLLWKRKVSYKPMHGCGSSPVRVGEMLVFSADGVDRPTLVALKAESGEVAWRVDRGADVERNFSFATPTVAKVDGSPQIISSASGMVGGYDPKDGRLIWKVETDGFSVTPKPLVSKGRAIVCTGFMKPEVISIRLEGAAGDVTGSHIEWEVKRTIPKVPSMVLQGGALYSVDDTGRVICLDEDSGEVRWRDRLAGNFSASPTLADGILYAPSEDGVMFLMKVSPEGGEVVEEIEMGDRLFASPVIVDGVLYQRSEKALWKITGK